jgi:hypothetical protein
VDTDEEHVTHVPEGRSEVVNGQLHAGPFSRVDRGRVIEVSVVDRGADPHAIAVLAPQWVKKGRRWARAV